ncbi:MAG TPA: hypothetical protein PLZ55_12590 [bacterium]|nr:hypothetical protein [bacterium]HPO09501.1 hypothetical protein [bacterium]HQO34579.1 hypothetical protein [bacterium]HQP97007.1 hypothetical protein [bacterium]
MEPPKFPSELRRDPHHGGWCVTTYHPEREAALNIPLADDPDSVPCAFCEGYETYTPPELAVVSPDSRRKPDSSGWQIRVVPNRLPTLTVEGVEEREGVGMFDRMRGVGAHEIVIESPRHSDRFSSFSIDRLSKILSVVQNRLLDLRKDIRMRYISACRLESPDSRGHLAHPHSQVVGSGATPPSLKTELASAREYYNYKERCLFCDILREEERSKDRLVASYETCVTVAPFASRFPFEVHILPRRHLHDFGLVPIEDLPGIAESLLDTCRRLDVVLPGWGRGLSLHTSPNTVPRHEYWRTIQQDYHWHIEIMPIPPRRQDWAELMGLPLCSVAPERAASALRNAPGLS